METTTEPASALENPATANVTAAVIDPCDYLQLIDRLFLVVMIVPAVVFIFILSFLVKRSHRSPGCCWGRPAVVQPLNMMDDFGRRWAFAACYLIIAFPILNLFLGFYLWDPMRIGDNDFKKNFGWITVFVKLGNVLHVCIDYYPLFACVSHRNLIGANILGFIYTIPYIAFEIIIFDDCPVDTDNNASYRRAVAQLLFRLPATISLFLLLFVYVFDFICNVRRCIKSRKSTGEIKTIDALKLMETFDAQYLHCVLYVEELLRRKEEKEERPEPTTIVQKVKAKILGLIDRFTYRPIIGFKYPVRLISTMAVSCFAIAFIAITVGLTVDPWIAGLQDIGTALAENLFSVNGTLKQRVPEYLLGFRVVFSLANALAVALQFVHMIHIIITCRHRMHKLFRGSHNWYKKSTSSPAAKLVSGMRYSGYQIAFFMFGWLFSYVVILVILIIFIVLFVLPIRYGERSFLIDKLLDLSPTVLLGLIITYSQVFLCKFVFLQDRGAYLAVNNRRLYHVASFFLFVLNVVVGVFAALKRILFSLIFGTLLLSRLDHVLLMRGFEGFDSGHTAYLSMLIVDVYHNHPVLRTFVLLLERSRESRKSSSSEAVAVSDDKDTDQETPRPKLRYRNLWLKSLTLINNPMLILERLQEEQRRNQADKSKKRNTLEDKLKFQESAEFIMSASTSGADAVARQRPETELSLTNRNVVVNGGQRKSRQLQDEQYV